MKKIFAALITACLLASAPAQSQEVLDAAMNEQIVMIHTGSGVLRADLETTIFKPAGDGPFPLLIMNHGKLKGDPHAQQRARFLAISREFVKRGYAVVLPMRRGFSKSTGIYASVGCNVDGNGQAQADDVQAALDHVLRQPWADREHILVAGQSHGGLTTLAFGMRHYPGVKGLINFAGGLRKENCPWQKSLVDAFGNYGRHTTLPSLWFYGENDSYFGPDLVEKMYAAYTKSGASAKLISFGPFKNDAHDMSGSRDGVKIWWPETEKFLTELGLPVDVVFNASNAPRLAKTDFAPIDNADAVPYLKENCRALYRNFLAKPAPRAFAISASGACGWSSGSDETVTRAMAFCQKNSRQACRPYAIDNDIVWKP